MSIAGNAYQFLRGAAFSVGTCVAVYLACDAVSDTIILRECHKLVLPLALGRDALTTELGGELQPGPWFSSMVRSSSSGTMYQCQFRLDGSQRSSDVTATVYRPPYTSTALYNLLGPGGTGVQVRSVDLMTQPGSEPAEKQALPPHLFHGASKAKSK